MKSEVLSAPEPVQPQVRNRGSWVTYESCPFDERLLIGQTTARSGRSEPTNGPRIPDQLARFLPGRRFHVPEQVHGDRVQSIRAHGSACYPGTDGLIAHRGGELLMVRVADCVPIVVWEPDRRVYGILHAGWRGLAKGIVSNLLTRLEAPPHFFLGAHIAQEHYEVGTEVVEAIGSTLGWERNELIRRGILTEDNFLSLRRVIKAQAEQSGGLRSLRFWNRDTAQPDSDLFSYRTSGTEERLLTWVVRPQP